MGYNTLCETTRQDTTRKMRSSPRKDVTTVQLTEIYGDAGTTASIGMLQYIVHVYPTVLVHSR